MIRAIDNPVFIKILLGGVALLYIFSLVNRSPHVDDAWLGDHAYWLAKTGQAKSELMRGITKQEEKIVVHHKLHTYLGAATIKVFGFSLPALKAISLISFLFFLLLFYGFTYKKLLSPTEFYLATTIILANTHIFNLSFVYRPEILVMALGFLSYTLLDKFLRNQGKIFLLVFAGLFAGLAVSTHLNGLIFPAAGFILLIWNKQFKGSIIFAFATLPTLGIYFLDMLSVADFQLWYYQISESPSVDTLNNKSQFIRLLQRIIDEQMRFLHSPAEISFTVLFLIAFIPAYQSLKQHKNLLRYTLLLMITMMMISVHKAPKYIILYLPYLVMVLSLSVKYIFQPNFKTQPFPKLISTKNYQRFIYFLIFAYFSVQLVYDLDISMNKLDKNQSRNITLKYIGADTDSLNIIAPMTFVFNEIEHFNRIQGEICYNELQKSDSTIYRTGFLKAADKFDIDYIILSEFFIGHFGIDRLNSDELQASNYEILLNTKEMVILKKHH